jgi:nitrate/TMAO reductase-like tetraheme cytochrome c subunit
MSTHEPYNSSTPRASRLMRFFPRNLVSQAGLMLAVVAIGNIAIFTIIDLISARQSPYAGILAYMVAPGFLICSFVLIGIGYWTDRRRTAQGEPPFPRIDLNDSRQRPAIFGLLTFLVVFVLISAVGSYKAYEFTETVQFCGLTCHGVMHPEYTAYQLSSHARVACVECHVGSGATWYVKSKMSGLRQVFATALNSYPRPIPTPVHNLRPAQQTCEECHWPRKFYGGQLKVFTHYAGDEKNTPIHIQMLIRTGGGDPATGAPEGIHWHMNIANQIDFVAADQKRQTIPYVHVRDMQGRVTEYHAKSSTLSKEQIDKAVKHRMDCIDCHNRPTHVYIPPDQAVDQSLLARHLDSSLPYLKQQAVAALSTHFDNTELALQGIAKSLREFYETKYPDLAKSKELEIRNAIDEVQKIYQRTTFPEMKVNWQTHPNNIGHFYFTGCFRCHDGEHVSTDGKVISKDCDLCHTIVSQQRATSLGSLTTQKFQHPIDIGDLTQVTCTDCHAGGASP